MENASQTPIPTEQLTATRTTPTMAKKFRLVRYFGFTSLIGVLIVLAPLVYFYRAFATEALEQHETHDNVAITRIFASTLWPKHAEYVKSASALSREQLRSHPEVGSIRADVLRQMNGLSVVKVKIYDLHGLTVFSTDEKQIGEDKSDDDGVQSAIAGKVVSEIAFENQFDSFEKVINDRNLISTYIPIRTNDNLPPEGVFEVYSDVTDYVTELEKASWEIVAVVLGSLALLYGFLYAIVRRVDQTLQAQELEVDKAHAAILEHHALHDRLTGLPNRESLSRQLDTLLRSLQTRNQKCAVLCVGLDGFKEINDSLGHQKGDAFLVKIAALLNDAFGEGYITARMGGDEFVITVVGFDGAQEVERLVQAVVQAQQVIAKIPIDTGASSLSITTSVGVAIYPDDGKNVAELLQAADVALSHAKKNGRNGYQFHTAGMNDRALELLIAERDLHRALEENQFVLYYQPKIDMRTGQITGAEALIRWQHPERGLVGPAQFIGLAEERGLIVAIGVWVLREACRQNIAWQLAGMESLPIAINLSAVHFNQPALVTDVKKTLADLALPAQCLELELTESSIMQDAAATISTMSQLKEVGVRLSLDDFGTGYSSLSQLKGLPLDNLKLDQSFVRGLPLDHDDLAICTAVIGMGQALGLKVIAEGVETIEQLAVLQALGCDVLQGYLFARPMPADQFLEFAMRHADNPATAFSGL